MSYTYGLGEIPITRPYNPQLSRSVKGGRSAVVVSRMTVGSIADCSTQTEKPPKDTRDASTLTKRYRNDFERSICTQTVRVHSPTVVVAYEVHAADTMRTASSTNTSAVNQVWSTAKVGSPPSQRAAVHQFSGDNSVAKYSYENYVIYHICYFWGKRRLFPRFKRGMMLEETVHSVCPEMIAAHVARRCAFETVVDPFCGTGCVAIQLALTCRKVIAVDIDPAKIKRARKNAAIYGVSRRIDFRVGDCYRILSGVEADAVVTCPPWLGKFHAKDIGSEKERGMAGVLKMAHQIAPRVVLELPYTIDRTQCLRVSRKAKFGRVEFEDIITDGCMNTMNMYLKSRQNDKPLGPAILSKVTLQFPNYRGNHCNRICSDE